MYFYKIKQMKIYFKFSKNKEMRKISDAFVIFAYVTIICGVVNKVYKLNKMMKF